MRPPRWRHAPPWWPENEPWPPSRGWHMWRRRRRYFVGRMALFFAALLFFVTLGVGSIVSSVSGGHAFGPRGIPVAWGVLAFVVLLTMVRRVGMPLGDIVDAANRVADGDFKARVREDGPPSLRTVGRAFNSMASRLEAQEQQRRHLVADIAHELRTPLSVIQGRLEGLLDGVYARDDAAIGEVLQEARLLARLVDDLRTLANAESGTLTLHREPTDLGVLTQDVVNAFSGDAARAQIALRVDAPADLPLVAVDPLRIREVLTNLLSNALRHTPAGGTVSITAKLSEQRIVVAVADTGSGIPADELPKIFDRFHKGTASRGSGLGLTIAKNLITAHGGEISAGSTLGRGTTITFTLPRP